MFFKYIVGLRITCGIDYDLIHLLWVLDLFISCTRQKCPLYLHKWMDPLNFMGRWPLFSCNSFIPRVKCFSNKFAEDLCKRGLPNLVWCIFSKLSCFVTTLNHFFVHGWLSVLKAVHVSVLCGLSLSVAIVWRAQSGNVFLFLIGDVHSSHGVLVTNFWPCGGRV